MSRFDGRRLAFALLTVISSLTVACVVDTGSGDADDYLNGVDEISQPVIDEEMSLQDGVIGLVSSFGSDVIPAGGTGAVTILHGQAQDLANSAESAVAAISQLSPPAICQEFDRLMSTAVQQISQQAFEYANGTDIVGMTQPRLDLEAIERGRQARTEAQEALAEASQSKGDC
jgi:hypothetical protein